MRHIHVLPELTYTRWFRTLFFQWYASLRHITWTNIQQVN